ncbi:hypothetical protein QTN47_01700 [Danxiaibacter flavus]|uniref:Transmembrane protein n=1 Tax=Danxiaibacter flavus TaxID=3049108 RepID=A0ABV3Z8J4_9BACT|nr:hypothetical protein QNM32_01700 [Chitinophagaceae bacterium DXS]
MYLTPMDAEKRKRNKRILLGLLIFFILFFAFGFYWFNLLKKDHKSTIATIEYCYYQGGRGGAQYVHFSYWVNKERYSDNKRLGNFCRTVTELNDRLKGLKITVLYNSNFPSNCYLLCVKDDYRKFNMLMPDSLSWMNDFLLCP